MEPPNHQFYRGREALFEFFGGTGGTDLPMHMVWHHLAFDPQTQIGFGEYTFALHQQEHGVAVVKLEGGKIKSWREYQSPSDLAWAKFSGQGEF